MHSIRYNLFETNSSSTHSLSIGFSDRKFTRAGKLIAGSSYIHRLMGENKNNVETVKRCTYTYSSEYDKLCVLFDMLFMHFYTQLHNFRKDTTYLERFRLEESDTEGVLYLRRVLDVLLHSIEYNEFLKPLKKRGIEFLADKNEYSKSETEYLNFDYSGYSFDFVKYVKLCGFRSIDDAVEKLVFDPKYVFSLYYSCNY